MKKLFVDGWKFWKSDLGTTYEDAMDHLGDFTEVEIPHDFQIAEFENFYKDACGWYYKKFNLEDADKVTMLIFDGAYVDTVVTVNGHKAGLWKYGYSQFICDISEYVHEGENTVLVALRCKYPSARWYTGGGIYRNVWLCQYEKTYIPENGVYIHTQKTEEGYLLYVDTEIYREYQNEEELINEYVDRNCGQREADDDKKLIEVFYTLVDSEGSELCQEMLDSNTLIKGKNQAAFLVEDVENWDIDNPVLYTLVVELKENGETIQREEISFGFREISFVPEKGFLINGRKVKLNGVCLHHDLGGLGVAFNKTAMRRRLIQLREMGVNALRFSHNMYDPQVLDLADEMGFLVISEAFDMWENSKTEFDYAKDFEKWHEKDVASWIRRDRNHPCVIMWSIGNEIYDTHLSERGLEVTKELKSLVELHDPRFNARVTIASNYMPWENAQKCADVYKLAGYNYAENCYDAHHKKYPDWVIYGSETYSIVQSRGIYHFPLSVPILSDTDLQCSSLGNSTTSWGAESMEACVCKDRDTDYSMGQFLWTGYDYIGEPTPYQTKNSYFGLIDTAGFYKDAYYVFKSAWTSYKDDPFVHLFPYWDFNPGQQIDLRVVSNAPVVELFLNGKSLGTKKLTHEKNSGWDIIADYRVCYEAGVIEAVAYDDDGNEVARDIHRSFGDTDSFVVDIDKRAGEDLIFAEISALDKEGNPVENATDYVEVSVEGGELMALDNGDSTDYDSYKGNVKRLFSGKLLAIVRPAGAAGDVKVNVKRADKKVPVRKILITSKDGQKLSADKRTIEVTAKIFPENAGYDDVVFRALNKKGTDTNIAKITQKGNTAVVEAMGDGEFVIRCESKCGSNHVRIISTLEFEAQGIGAVYLDPYGFIAGNLYSSFIGKVGNGNEFGVATDREKETVVTYDGIDFGIEGSDEITVPIFNISNVPFPIEIWKGIPGQDGAELLLSEVYDKPGIWNVYQDETWKLGKRLTGLNTISFKVNQKIHIKGFSFAKQLRALCEVSALSADSIYGDSFTKTDYSVEGIGNNVTLSFEDMNFGQNAVKNVVITGRATRGKNTIHLKMESKDGETREILEFPQTGDYQKISFPIEEKHGSYNVSFVFLPGSYFDFKSFRFE